LAVATVLILTTTRAQAGPLYTILNLGHVQVSPGGLNNSGAVVGDAIEPDDSFGAPFLYQSSGPAAGTFTDLSSVLGASAFLRGINDSGQIAGTMTTPGAVRGFLYSGGQVTLIQPVPGASTSNAYGLNNAGAVVGQAGSDGYIYQNGHLTDLGPGNVATAISNNGIAVGFGGSAFLYQNGRLTTIAAGEATGVNTSGQVVGWYTPSVTNGNPAPDHAFLYQNGKLTDLGTSGGPSSQAWGINSHGQVVGVLTTGSNPATPFHAFLDKNGTMYDLNKLVSPSSGWVLEQALAINNRGQILGIGIGPDGQSDAFLLDPVPGHEVPVPEPSTLAFFGMAAAAVALHRTWRRGWLVLGGKRPGS
jgi:probable HAF family extracellular repeat protein